MRPKCSLMLTLAAVILSLWGGIASGGVPSAINHQGYLTNAAGVPVNATVGITFSLYSSNPSRSNPVWSETQPSVAVSRGIYSARLGSVVPINAPFDVQYFLGIKVGSDAEMTPLQALTSVPYALQAKVADSVAEGAISGSMIASGAITPDKLYSSCAIGETLIRTASGWECGTTAFQCAAGDFISCYPAPAGTKDIGLCKTGIKTCLTEGTGFGPCIGAALPATESCDGKDNDCDGTIDNSAPCPEDQVCYNGSCGAACLGNPSACDDGIACTEDSCNPFTFIGCAHVPNDSVCYDGNPLTIDLCNVQTGCVHMPLEPACDDGFKNLFETDIDCGGLQCPKCSAGKYCVSNADCISGICSGGSYLCQ